MHRYECLAPLMAVSRCLTPERLQDRIRREAQERLGLMEVGVKVAITGGRHRGLLGVISYRCETSCYVSMRHVTLACVMLR